MALFGDEALAGDIDRMDRDLGVFFAEAGGNLILSSGMSNLGGAAICDFFALLGVCVISLGSSRALTQSYRPYSSASSSATFQVVSVVMTSVGIACRTEFRFDPYVTSNLVVACMIERFQIVSLRLFFVILRPRERDLEHASGTHTTILAPPLVSVLDRRKNVMAHALTIRKYDSG